MKKFIAFAFAVVALAASADDYVDFLYRWMPASDSIDYSREFWQENVDIALKARQEMPWGKSVPEREFRHFVLPVRVNNEDLDSARRVFYRELAPRVKNLSMAEAALEVNHWLHEKANYRPSDGRTSAPLATVRTTWGRCGEESTFGVAAMRSVGIPARQVYTPRWAHTDDNHAWVEVWIDGKWHFLGACEPEPILDLAWFNAPAARGMLMATNAFGHYDGPEQQLYQDSCYTRINVTDNYAQTRRASVQVVNEDGTPAVDVPVSFRLYNYAELYPLFSTRTDSEGRAELICGHGDLTAWASDGQKFGVVKLPAEAEADVILRMVACKNACSTLEMELTPPSPAVSLPKPTPEQVAENTRRFAYEDSIRNARMATFANDEFLSKAYGNHEVISVFLEAAADRDDAMRFLATLTDKDLRDVTAEVLKDCYLDRTPWVSPRIANELLTPFCGFFDANVPTELKAQWQGNPGAISKWIDENITLVDARNPNHYCISPAGVWRSRKADSHSRDIFYVALCRWMGIDARINPVTGQVEPTFRPATTSDGSQAGKPALLHLTYSGEMPADPAYYKHFTLSKIEDGVPQLLNYDDFTPLSNMTALSLEPGVYLLTTGRRMADGSVAARLELLTLTAGDTLTSELVIPDRPGQVSVIGSFNADPLLPITGRGFFVLGIIAPGHEPSTHLLNELMENRQAIEKWGKKVVLLFTSDEEMARFDRSKYPSLPTNVVFGVDTDQKYLHEMAEEFGFDPSKASFPALIVADTFNRVVFRSTGYNVGLGERITTLFPHLPE